MHGQQNVKKKKKIQHSKHEKSLKKRTPKILKKKKVNNPSPIQWWI